MCWSDVLITTLTRKQTCDSPTYLPYYSASRVWLVVCYADGGLSFVCEHGKHRNAERYNFGCNLFSSPPSSAR